jgi:hypothetical protein
VREKRRKTKTSKMNGQGKIIINETAAEKGGRGLWMACGKGKGGHATEEREREGVA